MQPIHMNLTLALAAALCVTACGGSSDENVLVDPPKAVTPAEQDELAASKIRRGEYDALNYNPQPYQIVANGTTLTSVSRQGGRWISQRDYRILQPGMTTLNGHYIDSNSGRASPEIIRSYQGFRSGALVTYNPNNGRASFWSVYGADPQHEHFPNAGRATYRGVAFDRTDQGTLTYHVDFGAKNGHGQIHGLDRHGTITLGEAVIDQKNRGYLSPGKASSEKSGMFDYAVGLAGHRTEEIAGYLYNTQSEAIGFHGTRGAITE